jgi:hypothetical protein
MRAGCSAHSLSVRIVHRRGLYRRGGPADFRRLRSSGPTSVPAISAPVVVMPRVVSFRQRGFGDAMAALPRHAHRPDHGAAMVEQRRFLSERPLSLRRADPPPRPREQLQKRPRRTGPHRTPFRRPVVRAGPTLEQDYPADVHPYWANLPRVAKAVGYLPGDWVRPRIRTAPLAGLGVGPDGAAAVCILDIFFPQAAVAGESGQSAAEEAP